MLDAAPQARSTEIRLGAELNHEYEIRWIGADHCSDDGIADSAKHEIWMKLE